MTDPTPASQQAPTPPSQQAPPPRDGLSHVTPHVTPHITPHVTPHVTPPGGPASLPAQTRDLSDSDPNSGDSNSGDPNSGDPSSGEQPNSGEPNAQRTELEDLRATVARLTLARDITHDFVGSSTGMQRLMELIFKRVLDVLDAEAGSLWMVDWTTRENVCHLAEGPSAKGVMGLRLPAGKGIVGQVIASGRSSVVLDTSKDAAFERGVDARTGFQTRSMICAPLQVNEHIYGAIQVINKKTGARGCFGQEDLLLVEDLATSAGLAIRNARLLESESRVREMATLMQLSRAVVATLDVDRILDTVVNSVNELANVSDACVALVNEVENNTRMAVLSGGRPIDPNDEIQKLQTEIMDEVRKAGHVAYVGDRQAYEQTDAGRRDSSPWARYLRAADLQAAWAAPLKDEEGVLGVLLFGSKNQHFARGNKSDLLTILASQATVALRNASVFRSVPIGSVLGRMATRGREVVLRGWKRWAAVAVLACSVIGGLHALPVLRWVSGPCVADAALGQGVFLPVAGTIARVLVDEGQSVESGDLLALLDETPLRLALTEATSAAAVIERQIVEARAASDVAQMRRATIERATAQARAAKARLDLERIAVRATRAGVILTPHPQELVGRALPLGAEVLRIANADANQMTVVVQIDEADLLDVEVGQTVRGTWRAQPGSGFRGVVRHLGRAYALPAPAVDQAAAAAAALPEGFVAEVEVSESDLRIRPGMTGKATIQTPNTSVVSRWWRGVRGTLAFWGIAQ